MGYLVPAWEIKDNDTNKFRLVTVEAMIHRALALGIVRRREDLTIRKLEPADLGLENWQIKNFNSRDWIYHNLSNNKIYGLYKLTALSIDPEAQHITIIKGGNTLFYGDLSEMYSGLNIIKALYKADFDEIRVTEKLLGKATSDLEKFMENKSLRCEAYLSEPIIYDPQEKIRVEIAPPSSKDVLVIVGFVTEPNGMTIVSSY